MRRLRPSKESLTTRYYIRLTKRMIRLVLMLFVLYVLIMAIIWAVPKVWNWALR